MKGNFVNKIGFFSKTFLSEINEKDKRDCKQKADVMEIDGYR